MSCDLRYLLCEKIIEKSTIESHLFVISLILENKNKRKSIINSFTESKINQKE
jgi:hypothetical protein